MTIDQDIAVGSDRLAEMLRQFEVERFYTDEAALLDAHRYEEWAQLFSDDTHYFMPIRRTRLWRELDKEFTKPGEIAFFDDNKQILLGRVAKLGSGTAWAEDPPSRTRHIVTNVRVVEDRGGELEVHSNFILYRTRLKSEETTWIGSRQDLLRHHEGSFLIARRHILLEQTLLLSQNLSNFF
ncbi:aromatic-ring-hydroxylating dioxygenase subunit beta [Pseudonocardia acidicola]|uniref:Aromatic-ring-hydroxylating dioxygenase subunit beta n=1 Tax=Pseudonocardia acidicola TaxID=2724939 RepID=A0ABX1S9Y2_9PSEU|nr:aromatic-ring-hydroxylating dioxygenase subunit beta [Pseudonocardia acidicola]NMH97362.1 aromatic-ring-hydroxylating dioxygenase subunit beta [Pseudonocardia acidicola]